MRRLKKVAFLLFLGAAVPVTAERPKAEVVATIGGEDVYQLRQLDAHEIVNDQIAGTAIAATW
jgi:hypothetical protein